MSNEQLIIYLYGIYPEGGFVLLLSVMWVILVLLWLPIIDGGGNLENKLHIVWKKVMKPFTIVMLVVWLLSALTPDKKTFLLLVATPTIMESYTEKNSKLNRLDKIIDKALIKADKALEDKNER